MQIEIKSSGLYINKHYNIIRNKLKSLYKNSNIYKF